MTNLVDTDRGKGWQDRFLLPAYRVKEAARYCKITGQTIGHWRRGRPKENLAPPGSDPKWSISYPELVEIAVMAAFRSAEIPLPSIRNIWDLSARHLDSHYPFTQLQFKLEGPMMFYDSLPLTVQYRGLPRAAVTEAKGRLVWRKPVSQRLAEFDYEDGLAVVWHVAGRDSPVKIDPRLRFRHANRPWPANMRNRRALRGW